MFSDGANWPVAVQQAGHIEDSIDLGNALLTPNWASHLRSSDLQRRWPLYNGVEEEAQRRYPMNCLDWFKFVHFREQINVEAKRCFWRRRIVPF